MDLKKLNTEELQGMFVSCKKEHKELHEKVEMYEKKRILTSEEKRDLTILRKKKLYKKDMMMYIKKVIDSKC